MCMFDIWSVGSRVVSFFSVYMDVENFILFYYVLFIFCCSAIMNTFIFLGDICFHFFMYIKDKIYRRLWSKLLHYLILPPPLHTRSDKLSVSLTILAPASKTGRVWEVFELQICLRPQMADCHRLLKFCPRLQADIPVQGGSIDSCSYSPRSVGKGTLHLKMFSHSGNAI